MLILVGNRGAARGTVQGGQTASAPGAGGHLLGLNVAQVTEPQIAGSHGIREGVMEHRRRPSYLVRSGMEVNSKDI